jgi:hypothetical protein
MRWSVLLAAAIAFLLAAASCELRVPLGVDPQSDAAPVDGGAGD